jgi:hypothetical protein
MHFGIASHLAAKQLLSSRPTRTAAVRDGLFGEGWGGEPPVAIVRGGDGAPRILSHSNGCTTKHLTFGDTCSMRCGSGPGRDDQFLFQVCARCKVAEREHCRRCCASPWNNASCRLAQQKATRFETAHQRACDAANGAASTTCPLSALSGSLRPWSTARSMSQLSSRLAVMQTCHSVQWYEV